jgi:hypothetical protein
MRGDRSRIGGNMSTCKRVKRRGVENSSEWCLKDGACDEEITEKINKQRTSIDDWKGQITPKVDMRWLIS